MPEKEATLVKAFLFMIRSDAPLIKKSACGMCKRLRGKLTTCGMSPSDQLVIALNPMSCLAYQPFKVPEKVDLWKYGVPFCGASPLVPRRVWGPGQDWMERELLVEQPRDTLGKTGSMFEPLAVEEHAVCFQPA